MGDRSLQTILDQLFRRESGRAVAYLARFLGADHLDLAESSVQEAYARAVQTWPTNGIPDRPAAWIFQVAKNSAIDALRNRKPMVPPSDILDSLEAPERFGNEASAAFENELSDDLLKLMFICCHPILAQESRIALTLKTVCGFSVSEIAKAFLVKEETIAQRIVRGKLKISENKIKFEVPAPAEIEARLQSVLDVIYLLFNEGYSATEGDSLIRRDLCEDAIYSAQFLSGNPLCRRPDLFALLALMHLQSSRFNARLNADHELLLLEEQDRSLWDRNHILLGFKYLEMSASGEALSDYHLQAGIASCHAAAASFRDTDWERILALYDLLLANNQSPVVALNRAVAISMIHGPAAALREIDSIKDLTPLKSYYLLPATMADLNRKLGHLSEAKALYEKALALVGTAPERSFIEKRIREFSLSRSDLN